MKNNKRINIIIIIATFFCLFLLLGIFESKTGSIASTSENVSNDRVRNSIDVSQFNEMDERELLKQKSQTFLERYKSTGNILYLRLSYFEKVSKVAFWIMILRLLMNFLKEFKFRKDKDISSNLNKKIGEINEEDSLKYRIILGKMIMDLVIIILIIILKIYIEIVR